jgi:hypothetical protein
MALLDIVTLAEAKARLGGSVTNVADDAAIQTDITALSALFDTRFGAVVQRNIADEPVTQPWPNTRTFPVTRSYVTAWAEYWPIIGTPTADVGTVAVMNAMFGRVELSTSAATTISYDAGRFGDTADVSEQFKSAFVIALRNWRQADHVAPFVPAGPDYPTPRSAFPTFAIPRACDQLLGKYRRPEGLS